MHRTSGKSETNENGAHFNINIDIKNMLNQQGIHPHPGPPCGGCDVGGGVWHWAFPEEEQSQRLGQPRLNLDAAAVNPAERIVWMWPTSRWSNAAVNAERLMLPVQITRILVIGHFRFRSQARTEVPELEVP